MNTADAKRVLETALICTPQPLHVRDMRSLFDDRLGVDTIKQLLADLQDEWAQRGVELVSVATGWRFQSRPEMREYLDRLHPEKPPATRGLCSRRWPSLPTDRRLHVVIWKTFGV